MAVCNVNLARCKMMQQCQVKNVFYTMTLLIVHDNPATVHMINFKHFVLSLPTFTVSEHCCSSMFDFEYLSFNICHPRDQSKLDTQFIKIDFLSRIINFSGQQCTMHQRNEQRNIASCQDILWSFGSLAPILPMSLLSISIHFLQPLNNYGFRGPEPIPADIRREAGYRPDMSLAYHMSNTERQATIHIDIHTQSLFRITN